LQQIFWNILKNAVKFTPASGNITVTSRVDAKKEELAISVSDSGIGMNADELSRVFGAFSQGDHAATGKQFGGLGLGLTISQKLLDSHSGKIHAASAGPGKGATFTITLPLAKTVEKNNGPAEAEFNGLQMPAKNQQRGLCILLVEDHESTRTSLAQLLIRRRHKVAAVASLGEARAAAKKENFDLLISDIGLPDGTGFDLMRELQDDFGLQGIALTGYGMEQDVAHSQKFGFVAHLTKPVRMETLDHALAAILDTKSNTPLKK
jgi:CheY-like chemotaxis protein